VLDDFRLAAFVDDNGHAAGGHGFGCRDAEVLGELGTGVGFVVESRRVLEDLGVFEKTAHLRVTDVRADAH
jgi:hypothetical protein